MPLDGNEGEFRRTISDIDVLRCAREGIARAWVQEALTEGNAHCAVGWVMAAAQALEADGSVDRVIDYLFLALPKSARYPSASITDRRGAVERYNDRHRRTQKRMVRLFDEALLSLSG